MQLKPECALKEKGFVFATWYNYMQACWDKGIKDGKEMKKKKEKKKKPF